MPNPLYQSLSLPWAGNWGTYLLTQDYGPTTNTGEWLHGHGVAGYWHTGLDLGIPQGTPLLAMADGTVIDTGHDSSGFFNGGYGWMLRIKYANGLISLFAHQSNIIVSAGQAVKRGQVVSYSGGGPPQGPGTNSGNSTGPHLHLSIFTNLYADVRPQLYISGGTVSAGAPGAAGSNPAVSGSGNDTTQISGPPVPPDLITPLPPNVGLDPHPIKVSVFGENGGNLGWQPDKTGMVLCVIDSYVLPLQTMEVTLSNYRVPGKFSATLSLDWIRRAGNKHILETLLAKTPTQVDFYAGYVADQRTASLSDLAPLFAGLTDPPQLSYTATGNTLSLSGPDLSGAFNQPGQTAPDTSLFGNKTSSEIAAELAARHNIAAHVGITKEPVSSYDGTSSLSTRTAGQTEWDLLVALAGQEGFVCYMDGSTLMFVPPPSLAALPAALALPYGPSDGHNSPVTTITLQPQPHSKREYSVVVQSYGSGAKKTSKGTANSPGLVAAVSSAIVAAATQAPAQQSPLDALGAALGITSAAPQTTASTATTGNPDAIQVITLNMPEGTPQSILQKKAQDVLTIYAATEVLLNAQIAGVLPIYRNQPIILHGSDVVPDLNNGSPYYPATLTYRYAQGTGLTQDITLTTRPLAVLTTEQLADITG